MSQPTFPGGIDLLPGPQGPPIPANALRIVTIGGAPFSTTDGITFTALGGGSSGWFTNEAAIHVAAVPALTESTPIVLGVSNDGAILDVNAVDAGVDGGALRGNSNTAWTLINKATIIAGLNTSPFALSFQGSLSPPAASKISYFGLTNSAGTPSKELVVATQQGTDAVNFIGFGYDGVGVTPTITLGPADANVYTWRIISDGTTVTFARAPKGGGGAALSSGTTPTATAHFPTGAAYVGFQNSAGTTGQRLYKCLFSYVGP